MQATILESIANNRRTAVKSCHASGKTFISAAAVLWWVTTYPDAIAITTAPTNFQVKTVLWGEIRDAAQKSARMGRVKYPHILEKEIKLSEKNYAIGLSTNETERFQGFRSGRILIIIDEAPGVRNEIWSAIQGLMASGDARLLAIGNPAIIGGPFHDAFTVNRANWSTYTISAFDTPNLQRVSLTFQDETGANVVVGHGQDLMELDESELDKNTRPYLCGRRWVKETFQEWGPLHPFFQYKVLGEFPTESDDTLIPLSWLERARVREGMKETAGVSIYCAGLDVAGPGEAETVLVIRDGPCIVLTKAWPQPDPRGSVVAALAPFKENLARLNVDSIGVGWNMFTYLRDIFGAKVVHAVNVGSEPRNKEKFANAKAEYYWGLRLRAQVGDLRGIDDDKMIGQLAAIRYSHNARGQVVIEGKDEMRKRGVKSPDRAEACMLAFVEKVRGETPQLFSVISEIRESPWRTSNEAREY
jgi:hypothetical protein